ncbi:MAG: XdhC family protein, partial [Bacteroidota bacterium]|nr:XdhC family protein [Bacteroidota bacterium]
MKELHDIIEAYNKAVLQSKQTALATVVKVEGSSYRRPGARMLVTEDGEITGAISGGCLEGDALRKALLAMAQNKNKLETYDTTGEDDATLGIQLGCNGIVSILFEPLQNNDAYNPIQLLQKAAQERKGAVIATIFNENKSLEQKGTCCFVNEEISCSLRVPDFVLDESKTVLRQKQTSVVRTDFQSVLYQYVSPAVHLVVVSAGNDAQPLIECATIIGWQTTVIDGRASHATKQ